MVVETDKMDINNLEPIIDHISLLQLLPNNADPFSMLDKTCSHGVWHGMWLLFTHIIVQNTDFVK